MLVLPGQPVPLPRGKRPGVDVVAGPGTYLRSGHLVASLLGHVHLVQLPTSATKTTAQRSAAPSKSIPSALNSTQQPSLTASVLPWRQGAAASPSPSQPSPSTSSSAAAQGATPTSSNLVAPQPGSIVLGRVTRVTPRQANVSILVVDQRPVGIVSAGGGSGIPPPPPPPPRRTSDPRPLAGMDPEVLYGSGGGELDHHGRTTRSAAGAATSLGSIGGGRANSAAGEDAAGHDFTGVIRSQDVRRTQLDAVRMAECFRPGDVVRAEVISMGDARSYYLSTASNHLGVLYALVPPLPTSVLPPFEEHDDDDDDDDGRAEGQGRRRNAHGDGFVVDALNVDEAVSHASRHVRLEPVSWSEMRHPQTGGVERRKVAKPEGVA